MSIRSRIKSALSRAKARSKASISKRKAQATKARAQVKSTVSKAVSRGKASARSIKAGGKPSPTPSRPTPTKVTQKPTPPSKPTSRKKPTTTTTTKVLTYQDTRDDPTLSAETKKAIIQARSKGYEFAVITRTKDGVVQQSTELRRRGGGRILEKTPFTTVISPKASESVQETKPTRDIRTTADVFKERLGLYDRLEKLSKTPVESLVSPIKGFERQQTVRGLTATSIAGATIGTVTGIGLFAYSLATKPVQTTTAVVSGFKQIGSDIKTQGLFTYLAPKVKDFGSRLKEDPTRAVEVVTGVTVVTKGVQVVSKVGRVTGSQVLKTGRTKIEPSKVFSPQVLDGSGKKFPTVPAGTNLSDLFKGQTRGVSATAGFPLKIRDVAKDIRKKPIEIAGTDPNIKKALFVTPTGEASPYFLRRQTFKDIFTFKAEREVAEYLFSPQVPLKAKGSFLLSPLRRLVPTPRNIRLATAQPRILDIEVPTGFGNIPFNIIKASQARIQKFGRGTRLYELEEFARQRGLKEGGVVGGRVSLGLTQEIEGLVAGRIQKVSAKEYTTFAGEVIPIDRYKLLPSLKPAEKIPSKKLPNLLKQQKTPKPKIQPSYKPKLDLPKYTPSYKPKYTPRYDPKYTPKYTPSYTPKYDPTYTPKYTPRYSPRYDPRYTPVPKLPFFGGGVGGRRRRALPKGKEVGGRFTRSFTAEVLGLKAPRKRKLKQRYTGFELRI